MNLKLLFRIEISNAFHAKLQPPKCFSLLQVVYIVDNMTVLINTF